MMPAPHNKRSIETLPYCARKRLRILASMSVIGAKSTCPPSPGNTIGAPRLSNASEATPVPVPGPIATMGLPGSRCPLPIDSRCSALRAGNALAIAAKSLMIVMCGQLRRVATLSAVKRQALFVKLISACSGIAATARQTRAKVESDCWSTPQSCCN